MAVAKSNELIQLETDLSYFEQEIENKHKNYWQNKETLKVMEKELEACRAIYADFKSQELKAASQDEIDKKIKPQLEHYEVLIARATAAIETLQLKISNYRTKESPHVDFLENQIEETTNKINSLKEELENLKHQSAYQERDAFVHKSTIKSIDEHMDARLKQEFGVTSKSFSLYATAAHTLKDISTGIVKPIGFIFSGIMGIWEIYKTYRNKALGQRKTIYANAVLNVVTAIASIAVIFAAAANPVVLAAMAIGVMVFGLYKESYITHQLRNQVAEKKKFIADKEAELEAIRKVNKNDARIKGLSLFINGHIRELNQLREQRFQSKRKVGFNTLYLVGGILTLLGVFFLPLAIVGAGILIGGAVIDAIDKRSNNKLTKVFSSQVPAKISPQVVFAETQVVKPQLQVKHQDTAQVLENLVEKKLHVDHATPRVIKCASKLAQGMIANVNQATNESTLNTKNSTYLKLVNQNKVITNQNKFGEDETEGEGEKETNPEKPHKQN